MPAGCRAGRDGSPHRRAERGSLPGCRNGDLATEDVGEDLHQQRVTLGKAAARDDRIDRQPRLLERLDDHARAERRRLDQRPVDLRRARRERHADEQAAAGRRRPARSGSRSTSRARADRTRPAEAPTPPRRGRRGGRTPRACRGCVVLGRHGVPREPPEDVADRRLPRLVAEVAGHDAVLDDAAHALDLDELVAEQQMAVARAHDHGERPRRGDGRRRHRAVEVDVPDRHRGSRPQPRPCRRRARSAPPARAPGGRSVRDSFSSTTCSKRGSSAAKYAGDGNPSRFDHIAL